MLSTLRRAANAELIRSQPLTMAQAEILDGAYPTPPDWFEITGMREAQEVMRSRKVSSPLSKTDKLVREGAASRLDGPAHSQRRKTLNRLVRRDGHVWYRETVMHPTLVRNLEAVFRETPPGVEVALDLVAFTDRVMTQLAAAIVGFDGVDTDEGLQELNRLDAAADPISRLAALEILYKDIDESAVQTYVEAWQGLTTRFYAPSLARRQEMIRRVEAGELSESDLPRDLLMLIAAHLDPAMSEEPSVGLREAMTSFRAASEGSSQVLTRAVQYLTDWFTKHPEDVARQTDPTFLLSATNEAIRMSNVTTYFIRRAEDDIVLSSGREIRAGQYVLVRVLAANRDPLFGPDAGEFNPHRKTPDGVYPYGLGFGSGPHMCFGVPLVLGTEGIDGSLVYTLGELYKVGIRPDPSSAPTRRPYDRPDDPQIATYPVLLGGSRGVKL